VQNVITMFTLNAACASLLALTAACAGAEPPAIPDYAAVYQVTERNKTTTVGTIEVAIRYDGAAANHQLVARLTAEGLAKPAVLRTFFRLVDGGLIRPLATRAEDGAPGGRVYEEVKFDWDAGVAVTTKADGRTYKTPLDAKTAVAKNNLQRLLQPVYQITLILPGRLRIAGFESRVEYVPAEPAEIETIFGALHTEAYVLHVDGHPTPTKVWVAPELGNVPVRLEDQTSRREAEVDTLVELHGIERSAPVGSTQPEPAAD
jgi:hypothetical protein